MSTSALQIICKTRDKNIYNVRGGRNGDESTKATHTSVQMAQHNESTRLHDLCIPTNPLV